MATEHLRLLLLNSNRILTLDENPILTTTTTATPAATTATRTVTVNMVDLPLLLREVAVTLLPLIKVGTREMVLREGDQLVLLTATEEVEEEAMIATETEEAIEGREGREVEGEETETIEVEEVSSTFF